MYKTKLNPVMMYGCKTWSITQNDSYIKYVEDEIFEQGVWPSNCKGSGEPVIEQVCGIK
jgi:hypothetical protein